MMNIFINDKFTKLWIIISCVSLSTQLPMMPRETSSCLERNQPGIICETCELLATCVKMTHGYLTVPVETCDTENGFYCNVNLGGCSNITGPCHPFGYEGNFICTSQGVFPDPYDCQRYHMCYVAGTTLVSANIECGGDKSFNVETGECTLSISDDVCNSMQYECPHAGYSAAWPNNNNLFYICKATTDDKSRILYPTIYRCGANEIFDGNMCVSDSNDSNKVTNKPNIPITSKPTKSSSMSPTNFSTSKPDIQCTTIGLQADPDDCHSYYYCSRISGAVKHTTCPRGTFYNPDLASCSIGNC